MPYKFAHRYADRPPRIRPRPTTGPYAVVGWDRRNSRWVQALTAAGHELIREFLAAYDDRPIKLFRTLFPEFARIAIWKHGADEVNHACRVGVVMAAARYTPGLAVFSNYVADWLRHAVQEWLYPDLGRIKNNVRHVSLTRNSHDKDGDRRSTDREWLAVYDPDPIEQLRTVEESLAENFPDSTPEERKVVAACFDMTGRIRTNVEAARHLGCSKMSVWVNIQKAIGKDPYEGRRQRPRKKIKPSGICRHCRVGKVSRPRGLCWSCYYAPGVRDLYKVTSKYAPSRFKQGAALA